ncbi:DoxX family protein [Flavobacterium sp. ZB4P13]|uniref:DoxX family protein n=1 Tax=Flavobacterium sp. ZB4P13 TaxID=3401728 RepID=UPI003AAA509A
MKKRNKIIYWTATGLFSVGMLGSGISQLLHTKEMNELVAHVGYPMYFMNIIGVWKTPALRSI